MKGFREHPLLKEKKLMEEGFTIVSDIHANWDHLSRLLDYLDKHGIRQVINLGDVVGYGKDYERVIKDLKDRKVISIPGNHDLAVLYQRKLSGQEIPAYSSIIGRLYSDMERALSKEKKEHLQRQIDMIAHSVIRGNHSDDSKLEMFLKQFSDNAKAVINDTADHISQGGANYLSLMESPFYVGRMLFVHATPKINSYDYIISLTEANDVFEHYMDPNGLCFMGHAHIPLMHIGIADGAEYETFLKRYHAFIAQDMQEFEGRKVFSLDGRILAKKGKAVSLMENYSFLVKVGAIGEPRDIPNSPCLVYVKDNEVRYISL